MPSARMRSSSLRSADLLGGVHAGGGLVEREQPSARWRARARSRGGAGRRRAGAGELVGARGDAHVVEQLAARAARWPPPPRAWRGCAAIAPNTPACVRTCRPIITFSSADRLANRRMFWKVRAMPSAAMRSGVEPLERARPRSATVALVLAVDAGDHVEERGLAGAVRADQAVDLALAGCAKVTSESAVRPPKRLRDAPDLEQRGAAARSLGGAPRRRRAASSRLRTAEGHRPAGRNSIISTIARPKSSMRITSGSMIERPKTMRCSGLHGVAQDLGHEGEQDRAQDHAPDVAHAAQHHHGAAP